ncbi:hypothetical protein F5148DRAFT_1300996 [Russula earlei]|uniref:Uncharacterized protein n=1 Tax=Russula earlei TaxID=71964 RepID=A0ACC0TXK0_9AGAM|nr:hypothetical protein F5148DRAFT_1300996 [Russula earlei]
MQRVILRPSRPILTRLNTFRSYASVSAPKPTPGPTRPYHPEKISPPREQSWLTRKLKQSPTAMRVFLRVFGALGYGSSRQVAARRALALYEQLCAIRAEEDREFWDEECHLPPTFQSWFTVTNLHVWMLTTRLRALPAPHAQAHIQGLIDHFFLDVEDRIRHVLQPKPHPQQDPSTSPSRSAGRAPEALVSKQMKIFREQWAGLGFALDLALAQGSDAVLAAAMWRNLLGARGARGLALALAPMSPVPEFRRAAGRAREEVRDDGSGVHDFGPEDRDAYVRFPETMLVLTAYVRGEVARLAGIPDETIMATGAALGREAEGVAALRFNKISSAQVLLDELLDGS